MNHCNRHILLIQVIGQHLADHVRGRLAGVVSIGAAAFLARAKSDGASFGGDEDVFGGGGEEVGGYAEFI